MINHHKRRTIRSPLPLIRTEDKWTHLLMTPPNRKPRAAALIQSNLFDDTSSLEEESSSDDEDYIFDGPKDAQHQWTLIKTTQQKLRRHALPLSEGLHLRKMLVHLHSAIVDDDDDVPLCNLLDSHRRYHSHIRHLRRYSPPPMMNPSMINYNYSSIPFVHYI